jgi:hypothetical protein
MSSIAKKEFVARYRAALKAKFTREEFAAYLGVKPDSAIRRRLEIKTSTGLDLPYLKSDPTFNGQLEVAKVEKFEDFFSELMSKDAPKTINAPNTQQVYVITSAQNATPVHDGFLATLLQYCSLRNAQLMVIPYRYKNPTSIWNEHNEDADYWWESIKPYIVDSKTRMCKGLQLLAQIKSQPTGVTPLSGFDAFTGSDSAILGHPKIQLKTVATPSKNMPKILTTTGACTIENYTDSKAGHKGRFHHNISALIVEVDGDKFHMRHVHGEDDGSFYDLEYYYTPHGRETYGRVAGFVPGDIHAEFIDPNVESAMFDGPNSIVEVLNPEVMVYHDLEDFYRRNHHHRGNDIVAYGKHHYKQDNVEEGLQLSADFIDRHTRAEMLNLIVRSNHDEAFERWLKESDPKDDPENARFYYYMKFNQLSNVKRTKTGYKTINAFKFWCENPLEQRGLTSVDNTKFLGRDESFVVGGIEIGFHGDSGINGSRGSIQAFSKIGPKTVIGHSHSPGIVEGAYQVGLCAYLDLEYASGPSSWLHTHCVIYPNGSRALINVINGEWRASYYNREFEAAA